jgi:hypothetical protein
MAEKIPTPEELNMASLGATNDPIPQSRKSLLVQVYQSHPLLKVMLDKASDKRVGEWVFGFDTARGPDHAAVTVFEKQPDGSLTMVASETQAELRPPAEHAGKPLHHIETPTGPEVWYWRNEWFRYRLELSGHPTWTRLLERLFDRPGNGNDPYLPGYRYLGPAEWVPEAQGNTDSVARHYVKLARMFADAEARVAALETENEALRVEKRALEGRGLRLSSEYPRAHNFGVPVRIYNNVRSTDLNVPSQTRSAAETMAQPTGDAPGGLRAIMDDPPTPTDEVHQAVQRVIGHIADGKVTPTGRQALRGALDKAEAPPTGRAKSDAAIGRIASLR